MSENIKRSEDIIAEMKRRREMLEDAASNAPLCYSTETMRAQYEILDEFIERFEAAHESELSKAASKNGADFGQLGNAAKLREALLKSREFIVRLVCSWEECEGIGCGEEEILQTIDSALAAPPRNCDVGDAHDWEKRFGDECDKGHICQDCPVYKAKRGFDKGARCEYIWAEMPYEEGGKYGN